MNKVKTRANKDSDLPDKGRTTVTAKRLRQTLLPGLTWSSGKTLVFSSDGKHFVDFPEGFPFLLKATNFSQDLHVTPSYHDFLEIVYVFEGSCIFHVCEKEYLCTTGDLVLIGNTEFHYLETRTKEILRDINLFFMPEFVYEAGSNETGLEYLKPFFGHSTGYSHWIPSTIVERSGMLNHLKAIYREICDQKECYQLAVKNHLREILIWLLRYYAHISPNVETYNTKKRNIERLSGVFRFLQTHYQQNISLEKAAETACMSTSYFCRFFKNVTGHTYTDYLSRLRVDKAKELLLRSNLPITTVGLEAGFENYSYFGRVFRRLTGKSPREYRKNQ